jgi:hypothetical protein
MSANNYAFIHITGHGEKAKLETEGTGRDLIDLIASVLEANEQAKLLFTLALKAVEVKQHRQQTLN